MKTIRQPVRTPRRHLYFSTLAAAALVIFVAAPFLFREQIPASYVLTDPAPQGGVYTRVAAPLRIAKPVLAMPALAKPAEGTATWQVLPNSPLAPYYHHDDIFFINQQIGWLCNISGEIWKTTNAGHNWTRVWNQPSAAFRTITFVDEMKGWAGNLGPGSWVGGVPDTNPLYATTDGGITWAPVTNINGPTPDGICGLYSVGKNTIHGAGRYAGDSYFISSTDGGASWISQNLSMDYDAFVDVFFITPETGYITGSNANGDAVLLYTTDGGANWTTAMSNNSYHYWKMGFASNSFGYAVCWSGPDANKWIQTYDGGKTWTESVWGGSDANGIGFINEQIGWIGPHLPDGTFETLDGGESWHVIDIDPIYDDSINKFFRVGDVMYAAGNRVFKYSKHHFHTADPSSPIPFNGESSSDSGKRTEIDNSLCKITANPNSDGGTSITYTVPEADNVQITIYVRGGLIYDRPIDKHHQAGTYTIKFSPHDNTDVLNRARRYTDELYASIVTGRYRQTVKFINRE